MRSGDRVTDWFFAFPDSSYVRHRYAAGARPLLTQALDEVCRFISVNRRGFFLSRLGGEHLLEQGLEVAAHINFPSASI